MTGEAGCAMMEVRSQNEWRRIKDTKRRNIEFGAIRIVEKMINSIRGIKREEGDNVTK